jgi:uncharacterized protein
VGLCEGSKGSGVGHSDAQSRVGFMYLHGYGVKKDYIKAFEWFTKAAEQNHAVAINNVLKWTRRRKRLR